MRRLVAAVPLLLAACVPPEPVVEASGQAPPPVQGAELASEGGRLVVPDGYAAIPMAGGLVDPRAIAFDAAGHPLVVEGEPARLSRLDGPDQLVPVATGGGNGPWTGVAQSRGRLYVAEAGGPLGGRILGVDDRGGVRPVTGALPAGNTVGPLTAGDDGWLYVGVATVGAVPGAKDQPCQDVRLRGGGRIEGAVPCTGSVLRVRPDGGQVEVYAWGFHDPAGLAFAPDGTLMVGEHLAMRDPYKPQLAAPDPLYAARPGVWYGWPDYAGQLALADPQLADVPNPPPPPLAAVNGEMLAVAAPGRAGPFGRLGTVFMAVLPAGEGGQVMFADAQGNVVVPFAANLHQPNALAFGPDGRSLWVADAGTGTLWKIEPL